MKFKHLVLPGMLLLFAYGFWISPDFKTIAAGIAIFLFGMLSLEQGFHAFSGGLLEKILRTSTDRPWKSLSFGVVTTALMQSSSLVSLITISFLNAGLVDLTAGIGIVFGANLGTTTGAWLIAGFGLKVDIAAYAMPLLAVGILLVFQDSKALKGLGYILSGLGFLLLGIYYMKEGLAAFQKNVDLSIYALPGLEGLIVYTLLGIGATVVMQSSHASLMLIITALAFRQITYENALALTIGANIGSTITAILGSLGANVQGKRLAAAHFLFNAFTGLIAIVLIKQFTLAADLLSARLNIDADDYVLKLALFHSLFNFAGIFIMLPFIETLENLLRRVFKEREITVDKPRYLDDSAQDFPAAATELVRQETLHLYANAAHIILRMLGLPKKQVYSDSDLAAVISEYPTVPEYNVDSAYERNIKGIYSAIIAFISRSRFSREQEESGGLYWLREANRNIVEALKSAKHLQKNLYRVLARHSDYYAQQQYQTIRLQLAAFFRELERLKAEAESGELTLLALDSLKAAIETEDRRMNRTLDALIRERRLTPEMGTSLLNDSAYMSEIKRCLVKMAATVFVEHHLETTLAQRQLALNDAELHAAVERRHE
ncbi:MAG: Na/Pi cotransporter family protein [Gammaproteobacteria bacterium]